MVAHVFEEVHEAERGVEFMTTTREDWRGSSYEVHITWHLALYYLGKQRNSYTAFIIVFDISTCSYLALLASFQGSPVLKHWE